jgi:hypothetical protein
VTLVRGVPRPVYHDELSYLLAADTFAHGRASSPPHPRWQHFESFHVLQQPRYASKYAPGQGLLLAFGQLVGGPGPWWDGARWPGPIAGVWLGVFAMSAALTWMLRGFVPARWALFGGLLGVVQIAATTYWGQGYWGGALAAAGAALVFGATARIPRARAVAGAARQGAVLGAGLVILASTRPFEGALVSLAAAGVLAAWAARGRRRSVERVLAVAAPAAVVLALGLGMTLLYNRAVTGDAFETPYAAHDRTYLATPSFVFQARPPVPEYRHELHRRFYVDYLVSSFESQQTWSGWARARASRLARSWRVLLGPVLTTALVASLFCVRARGVRLALAGGALFLIAVALTTSHHAHYAAPLVPLLLLAAVQGTRAAVLRLPRPRRRRGLAIALVLAAALLARLAIPDPVLGIGRARSANLAKLSIERHLASLGGDHLVFVRHGRFADIHDEWVANGADIDARRIVWARAMTPAADAELRHYYRDRRAWRVDIAVERPGVVDFVETSGEPPSPPSNRNSPPPPP